MESWTDECPLAADYRGGAAEAGPVSAAEKKAERDEGLLKEKWWQPGIPLSAFDRLKPISLKVLGMANNVFPGK
jgi:hypothetical protein